jgi:murein DD-endopeptidase MepM/ murein hydrolase activator NlpD
VRYYDSLGAAGYPISAPCNTMPCSFDEHLARGSRGGVDFAVGVGSPVYAPTLGVVENATNPSAGNYVNFRHIGDNGQPTGFYDQFMHLSRFVTPGWYGPGDIIGYSGNTGSSTGPHIHWDLVNPVGKVVRQWEYFTNEPTISGDDDMKYVGDSVKKWTYLIGSEYLYCVADAVQAIDVAWQFGPAKMHSATADFKRMALAFGVPGEVVDSMKPGGKWSRLDTIQPGGGATPAQIAAAVDASLKDDFAGIPKSVNDDVAKRMSS